MALNGLVCADVRLRNCSLTATCYQDGHSFQMQRITSQHVLYIAIY